VGTYKGGVICTGYIGGTKMGMGVKKRKKTNPYRGGADQDEGDEDHLKFGGGWKPKLVQRQGSH